MLEAQLTKVAIEASAAVVHQRGIEASKQLSDRDIAALFPPVEQSIEESIRRITMALNITHSVNLREHSRNVACRSGPSRHLNVLIY